MINKNFWSKTVKIKFRTVFIILLLLFLIFCMFGTLVRHTYLGGPRFGVLKDFAKFFSTLPLNILNIEEIIKRSSDKSYDSQVKFAYTKKKSSKGNFEIYEKNPKNALLLLSRYDGDKNKSVIELYDLNNFNKIHTYEPDIESINKVTLNKEIDLFKDLNRDHHKNRYRITHPFINSDASIIFKSHDAPLVKTSFCKKILWINDDLRYSHSISEKYDDGSLLVVSKLYPFEISHLPKNSKIENFVDFGIVNVDANTGKIISKKSVGEILIKNNLEHLVFNTANADPIHLNDIEFANIDNEFFSKGDLFISLRNISTIIQIDYKNEIVKNIFRGDFINQHDVDLHENGFSFFNNNTIYAGTNSRNILENSEIINYDFRQNKFTKINNEKLKSLNFKAETQGLHKILDDGSLFVEASPTGRILFFGANKNLEWEYNNFNNDGLKYILNWSRIIDNENKVNNIKKTIRNKKC